MDNDRHMFAWKERWIENSQMVYIHIHALIFQILLDFLRPPYQPQLLAESWGLVENAFSKTFLTHTPSLSHINPLVAYTKIVAHTQITPPEKKPERKLPRKKHIGNMRGILE